MFKLVLDDVDFMTDADRSLEDFDREVDVAAKNAAEEGVKEEQRTHPYTDRTQRLTGEAHVEPAETGDGFGFDMVWPTEYAQFVNAKPNYEFLPIAEERASDVLKYDLANAVDNFKDKF